MTAPYSDMPADVAALRAQLTEAHQQTETLTASLARALGVDRTWSAAQLLELVRVQGEQRDELRTQLAEAQLANGELVTLVDQANREARAAEAARAETERLLGRRCTELDEAQRALHSARAVADLKALDTALSLRCTIPGAQDVRHQIQQTVRV